MNREILFRGFRPDEEGSKKVFINGEWIRGYWVEGNLEQCTVSDEVGERTECTISSYFRGIDASCGVNNDVLPETVGQYIGLTDKNGKKIFEYDIVQCVTGRVCKVDYFVSPGVAGFDLVPIAGFDKKPPYTWSLFSDTEVIGTIHDSPELIGGVGDA